MKLPALYLIERLRQIRNLKFILSMQKIFIQIPMKLDELAIDFLNYEQSK